MSKTAAIAFAPTTSLFARLLAAIDRALTASAAHLAAQRRPAALRPLSLSATLPRLSALWRAAAA